MLSSLDPASEQFLNALNRIQTRLNTAQQQIASGLKVTRPSDAPDQISSILELHAALARNTETGTELGQFKTEADTAEAAISSSVDLLERANVIATQATGPNQTADTRAALAQEVGSLQERIVAISRTATGGRYIFSGDADQAPSYQLDPASANGVDRLQLSADTRMAQAPGGITFAAGQSANDIFDHRNADDTYAPDNVFAALNGLKVALQANDSAGIQAAIPALTNSSTYLNNRLAFYGQLQDRIAAGLSDQQQTDLRLNTELSSKQDADSVAAIQELNLSQTQLQAALTSRARMPRTSLFELL